MIYIYCNLVTFNIATVINNNNVPIGECFRVSWYTKQTSDYSKARNKESTYTDEQEMISMQ